MNKNLKTIVALTALLSFLQCGSSLAGASWVCSITSATAVDEDGSIGPPDFGGLERPTFFNVDEDKMEVTLLAPESRRGEVTKIDKIHKGEGTWIFSGLEEARAWSLLISEKGHVTLSIASDGAVWTIFGQALSR